MSLKQLLVASALGTAIVAPSTAWGITCFDLPEEARAAGALQGLSTCGMSVAEARRVLGYAQAAPAPRLYHRRHRAVPPSPY